MSKPMLHRAAESDFNTDGRNLEGIAFRWNTPSRVTDDGIHFYDEAFSPGATDKTLRERAAVPLPVGIFHPWRTPDWDAPIVSPVGAVKFRSSEEGLVFRARLESSEQAEEARQRLIAGELGDVSVGFVSHKENERDGIMYRTEIALYEMSLAPIGTGQHKDAKVLAMRAANKNASVKDIADTLALMLRP